MTLDTSRHQDLLSLVTRLPSDFEPYGERSRDTDWGPDCSCGCRWYVPLEGGQRFDWGVCTNRSSPRCGLLTFEHQGCREFEAKGIVGEAPVDSTTVELDICRPFAGLEQTLLANLRTRDADLERLLEASSGHWGYEDPIYRFYHQSFKVYALQRRTQEIVHQLAELLPERELDPVFVGIVGAGTGHCFEPDHNRRWAQVTRPILEAFFHARYFLEMAVRYSALPDPPSPLPSGYAALLCLFGLR